MTEEKAAEKEMKVVCFNLADDEFGLAVDQVLGVNPMMEIYHVPKALNFIEGVIRIRDKVIPVIDLRKRLGISAVLPAGQASAKGAGKLQEIQKKRIIIAKVSQVRLGVIVDGVSSVISIPAGNIEPPASVLEHACVLKAVGKLENRLLLLLDLDKILSQEEVKTLIKVPKKIKPKKEKSGGARNDFSS